MGRIRMFLTLTNIEQHPVELPVARPPLKRKDF